VSVCLYVKRRYCIKTTELRITQITPRDSPGTLVFWRQKSLVDDPPSPWNLRPHAFQTAQFRPISAHSASPWELAKKVQLALIASRQRAFQRAIDEPCTLPLSPPQGGTKRDFFYFSVNFKFCRKKSAAKFFHVKTSSGKVVATSFLYLMVHRCIAGDVPIYLKFALKVTHPLSENADFDRFHLTVPQPWELARIAIIANRKSTTRFPSNHRWTLCVIPKSPKGWLKTRIFTFGVACHYFVAGNRRHFKFNTWVGHSNSQPADDKPSLKWAWPRQVTHFKFLVLPKISLERLKLETSNLVGLLIIASPSLRTTNCPKGAWSLSRDLFNFWKISDNISKTVRDSLIVSIKFE